MSPFSDEASPSVSTASLPKRECTLPQVIENLGTGPAQFRTTLLSSPVWFADGAELLLISSVTKAVSVEWDLASFQKGLIVSLVFIGVFCGNLLSGPLGDEYGRRLPILLSFLLIFVFSMLSACTFGFWSLGAARFLVGVAIGVGQPAQQAMVSETSPSKYRVVFTSAGMMIFAVGEIYSGLLLYADDPYMKTLHWRLLLIAGALPIAVFGMLALCFLQQSPLYLACGGRYEETQVVLESMRRDNSAPQVSIDFKPHRALCGGSAVQSALSRQLGIIFNQTLLVTTAVLGYCCFVMNLCYYGSLYAFPQVMVGEVDLGSTPAMGLVYGSMVEIVGSIISIVMILYLRRKSMMRVYLLGTASSLALFAASPAMDSAAFAQCLAMVGYYGVKLCANMGFQIFYLYATEVYPTVARATGVSLVAALGRIASTIAPLVYEVIISISGHFAVFFWLMATLCAINLPLISLLGKETYGTVIEDDEEAEEATSSSGQPSGRYGSTASAAAERAA